MLEESIVRNKYLLETSIQEPVTNMYADVLLLNLLTSSEVCLFNAMLCIDIYYKGYFHPHPLAFNFIILNIRFMDLVVITFEKDFHINIIINLYIRDSKCIK